MMLAFCENLLQVGQPMSVLSFSTCAAMVEVVWISNCYLLRLVSNEPDASANILCHWTFESAFAKQAVDCLNLVPTLFRWDFRQISGGLLDPLLIVELNPDPVDSNFPVEVAISVFEVAKNRHRDVEFGQLLASHWAEPGILHGTGDGILAQAVVQVHVVEGSDAAAELAILANLPGDEQGILLVGERRDPGRIQVVEVAIEDIKAKVAHFRLGDAQRLQRFRDHRRRAGVLVIIVLMMKAIFFGPG